MKSLLTRITKYFSGLSLQQKIRISYLSLIIPIAVFAIYSVFAFVRMNAKYETMIESASAASQFSLEFKEDFDYETYLLIVGSKNFADSSVYEMIRSAMDVALELEETGTSEESKQIAASIENYLLNLREYVQSIESNIHEGNMYEENLTIWENDVQIVTDLIQSEITEYIHSEMDSLEKMNRSSQAIYERIVKIELVLAGLLVILFSVMSYTIPRNITRPVQDLVDVTQKISDGEMGVRAESETGSVEIDKLSESLNTMLDRINELMENNQREQIKLRKTELELLQAQINPHFLYNTLDTIVWLAETGEKEQVVYMVSCLSEFFRTSLQKGNGIVELGSEIRHVRSYLEIQQVRYRDILEYEIDIPEELSRCRIPKITLQPLVENALYHGIKNKRGGGRIKVTGRLEADGVYIDVTDDGIGMDTEELDRVRGEISDRARRRDTGKVSATESASDVSSCEKLTAADKQSASDTASRKQAGAVTGGFGIYNVSERIRLQFGSPYGVSIESEKGVGTTCSVHLPEPEVE